MQHVYVTTITYDPFSLALAFSSYCLGSSFTPKSSFYPILFQSNTGSVNPALSNNCLSV